MLAAEFVYSDDHAFVHMLTHVESGIALPSHLSRARPGEIVAVHFVVASIDLRASGRIVTIGNERRIVLASRDVERLRSLVKPSSTGVSFGAVSGDSIGGTTEVMDFDDLPVASSASPLEVAPTPPTGFEPPLPTSGRRTPRPSGRPEGHANLVGRTLGGKYVVGERLGAGSMGAVFRGRQLPLGTEVAIKAMHPELARTPTFADRFFREAQAAAMLDHPGAVRVLDFGEEPDGLAYIVTEFVHGRDLASVLEQEGPLATDRIVSIALQVLAVLGHAHEAGLVHRDVKPDNVMLVPHTTDDGESAEQVKLCDFGIAKILEPAGSAGRSAGSLTGQGYIVGTPEYMSPEQAQGDPIDGRSDIYAVGVMLFFLLTGELPFGGETAVKVLIEQITKVPDPPSKRRPRADPRFDAVCLRAMAKNPKDRYESARSMRRAIRLAFVPPGTMLGASSYVVLPPATASAATAPSPRALSKSATATAAGRAASEHPTLLAPRVAVARLHQWGAWAWPFAAGIVATAIVLLAAWVLASKH